MTNELLEVEHLLRVCKPREAIELLEGKLTEQADQIARAYAYYLLGNAYRQLGNWRKAISNYHMSVEIDANSLAAEALKNANEILDFYNHDLYNP